MIQRIHQSPSGNVTMEVEVMYLIKKKGQMTVTYPEPLEASWAFMQAAVMDHPIAGDTGKEENKTQTSKTGAGEDREYDPRRFACSHWRHNKTGKVVRTAGTAKNCTNSVDGQLMVIYSYTDSPCVQTFTREASEFLEKFTAVLGAR